MRIISLLRRLGSNPFNANVIRLASGSLIGQGIVLLASPVVTRLYSPEDFGLLGIYLSLVGMLAVATALRLELAIPLAKSQSDADSVIMLCAGAIVFTSCIVAFVLYFGGESIFTLMNGEQLTPYWWYIPLGVSAIGFYQVYNYASVRAANYSAIARTKLYQGVVTVIVQVGAHTFGVLGLLLADILARSAGTTYLRSRYKAANSNTRPSMRNCWDILLRFRKFPLISAPSGLINSAGLYLPPILLAALYDIKTAGLFVLVQRIISGPAGLVSQSVATVFIGNAAQLVRNDPMKLRPLFVSVLKRLFTIGLLPFILLAVMAPVLFGVVFGDEWTEAGLYASILAPAFLAQFVTGPISHTLIILERQEVQFLWDTIRLLLLITLFSVAQFVEITKLNFILCYSLLMVIGYLLLIVLSYSVIKQYSGGQLEKRS